MFVLILAFGCVAAVLPVLASRIGRGVFYVAAAVPAAAFIWGVGAYGQISDSGPLLEQA
ncbi:MAG: hypothetical protein F2864_04635, partial [Actinobacteria bacterium]|nr:hypothetical protein [Actinomycetota bacterium]